MRIMTRTILGLILASLLAAPAAAQGFDPAAQRMEMERVQAQTQVNAAAAASFQAQAAVATQHLQAAGRTEGGVAAAVAGDAALRAEAARQEELRRRAAEELDRQLEERLRTRVAQPR